jgi:long-subunit acyl-CoA synthetase (AMP-forming)
MSQGYGLTETCGPAFIANPYRPSQAGTVGPPLAGVDTRLEYDLLLNASVVHSAVSALSAMMYSFPQTNIIIFPDSLF